MRYRILRIAAVGFACGVLLSAIARAELREVRSGFYVEDTREKSLPLPPGGMVTINAASTLSGEITLRAGGDDCTVKYRKRMKVESKQIAEEYADIMTVQLEQAPDGLALSFRAPSPAPWSETNNSGSIEVEITVPDSCRIMINTSYFGIDANGPFSEVYVSEALGRVVLSGIYHVVRARVSSHPLLVRNVSGKCELDNRYGEIRLENARSEGERCEIRNENGKVEITSFVGEIDLRTSYDRIVGKNLFLTGDRNDIRNISAPIELSLDSLTSGSIRVSNNYGPIDLTVTGRTDATFICRKAETSRIEVQKLMIHPTLVLDDRLEFDTGSGDAEVRLRTKGDGNIRVSGALDTQF
jgi:hypothetical protein